MFDKELPHFQLEVNGVEELIDPNQDLRIYEGDLITEFSEQSAKFAFYGGLYSDALTTLEQFKNQIRKYEAEKEPTMRDRILARFGDSERITEAKIANEYARDEGWQELNDAVLEWKKIVGRLEMVKEAFKQRSSMLWSIGSVRKQEMVRLSSATPELEQD